MKNLAKKINALHNGMVRNTIETAIEIGRLLVEQKELLDHGQWEKWQEDNLDFSKSTVLRYTDAYKKSQEDENTNLNEYKLSELYAEIEKGKKNKKSNQYHRDNDNARKVIRELFADRKHDFQNPPKGTVLNQIINGDTLDVMRKMKANSVHLICTSVPYNNSLFYGPNCNDNKPYQEYLDWLGEFMFQCYRVLVKGGRCIVNVDNMTNKDKDKDGEFTYRHALDCDLRYKVRELKLGFKEYQDITWYKFNNGGAKIICWGSHASPSQPNFRNCKEHFLIWGKDEYKLPQPKGVEADISDEDFEEWTYNVWKLHPNTNKNCPHPCTWPERLTERFVQLFSWPGQTVLDPFCGSGTTCLSAKKLGRSFIGIDQNPNYCSWAKDRVEGNNMDMVLAEFLLSVKSELEKRLSPELVAQKYGRYFRMAKPKTKKAVSKKSTSKNVTFPRLAPSNTKNNSKKKSA
jgi:site-specific DNA-methyltransferase (adenine-specific)